MLKELKIENLALIDTLHLTFKSKSAAEAVAAGLTVFTGETGAGKSIVLQAINLLSGGKGSANLIRTGAKTAVVEARFEIAAGRHELLDLIRNKGFEIEDCLVIKRRFSSDGRSKFYINGSLSTARMAGEITENLLNMASQHDHQQLLQPRRHLDFVDTIGELWPERLEFGALYEHWVTIKAQYQALRQQEKEKEQRREYLLFQCKEIREAHISPSEDKVLDLEKNRLRSADTLLNLGGSSYQILNETVIDNLAQIRKNLEKISTLDQSITPLYEEMAGCSYQLEDLAGKLRDYLGAIPDDPAQMEAVTARIDILQRMKRKYGNASGDAGTLEEVLACLERGEKELAEFDSLDQKSAGLVREIKEIEQQLLNKAAGLTAAREKIAHWLTSAMQNELHSLCFDNAVFKVSFGTAEHNRGKAELSDLTQTGGDRPEFIFSANPGEPAKTLAKIASGGELSRLMLAFKCILARKDKVETVIFDEVDAGIGGKAAAAVARKIKELAGHHQVLCITHLPQIAARADEHFLVLKSVITDRTYTSISRLSHELKIKELSRMLAGDSITAHTVAYAQELIERNRQVNE